MYEYKTTNTALNDQINLLTGQNQQLQGQLLQTDPNYQVNLKLEIKNLREILIEKESYITKLETRFKNDYQELGEFKDKEIRVQNMMMGQYEQHIKLLQIARQPKIQP